MPGFLFLAHLFHFIEEFVSCFIKKMETTPVNLLFLHPVLPDSKSGLMNINRDVAQLVAHYVRDVGVGRSSRLIPTDGRDGLKVNLALRPSLFYIESCAIQEFRPHHDLMHIKIKSWCGLSCNPCRLLMFRCFLLLRTTILCLKTGWVPTCSSRVCCSL